MPLSTSIYKKERAATLWWLFCVFLNSKAQLPPFQEHRPHHRPPWLLSCHYHQWCLSAQAKGWLLNLCNINLEPFRSHLNGQSSSNPSLCQPQCRWYLLSCKPFSATNENRYIADYKTLISTDQDTAAGSMVTVTGWGTTSEGALGLPNVLHKVILVLVFPMSSILWCSRQRCKKWQTRQTCLC